MAAAIAYLTCRISLSLTGRPSSESWRSLSIPGFRNDCQAGSVADDLDKRKRGRLSRRRANAKNDIGRGLLVAEFEPSGAQCRGHGAASRSRMISRSRRRRLVSPLCPSIADIRRCRWDVRKVPIAEMPRTMRRRCGSSANSVSRHDAAGGTLSAIPKMGHVHLAPGHGAGSMHSSVSFFWRSDNRRPFVMSPSMPAGAAWSHIAPAGAATLAGALGIFAHVVRPLGSPVKLYKPLALCRTIRTA